MLPVAISKSYILAIIAAHDKVDIEKVVEQPTLFDHRISEYVAKADGVDIACSWQLRNEVQLHR